MQQGEQQKEFIADEIEAENVRETITKLVNHIFCQDIPS